MAPADMIHLPILRGGQPYRSMRRATLSHLVSGEPIAEVSLANRGLIARDLSGLEIGRSALDALSVTDLLAICKRAAELFAHSDLPLDERTQTPDEYVEQLSSTTGLPHTLCRENMEKIRLALDEMDTVLDSLTRGLDLEILDVGWGTQEGRTLSFARQCRALGAVLPNNSPGVHTLWLPAVPLKVPLALRPGAQEPWTPFRIAQAFIVAGCPAGAFGFYPSDYGGSTEIFLRCERSMLFGGDATVQPWKADPGIQIHGPGRSKIVIGHDVADEWERHIDWIARSVADNSGRSCINASSVWVAEHGRQIAGALADRLASIKPLPLDDPQARLAAYANRDSAELLGKTVENYLKQEGAEDLTAPLREGDIAVEAHDCVFLQPTVVFCQEPAHPLANAEYLFPFVSVVETASEQLPELLGPSLVVTAVSDDESFIRRMLNYPHFDRLNIGPIPTHRIARDQPHEGNLFEHLFKQRAFRHL